MKKYIFINLLICCLLFFLNLEKINAEDINSKTKEEKIDYLIEVKTKHIKKEDDRKIHNLNEYDNIDFFDKFVRFIFDKRNFLRIAEDNIDKNKIVVEEVHDSGDAISYLFVLKKEELENFKKAMLNGGSFNCDLIKHDGFENKTITIEIANNHAFLDVYNHSYAISLNEFKKIMNLKY